MYQTDKYSLNIISRLPEFDGESLRKYKVEGVETVGVWGNEPFEIHFKNNTWKKIQVKISLDGTDILTGAPATTEATDKMWVVNGMETLKLKAWPESNNGGAGFVFTSGENSVALHTHGDVSHRGIIAAAVYTEGHVDERVTHHHHHHHNNHWWYTYPYYYPYYIGGGMTFGSSGTATGDNYKGYPSSSRGISLGGMVNGTTTGTLSYNADNTYSSNSIQANYLNSADAASTTLASNASVGAGSYTEQQISYTTGLIKPLFTETVRVKYLWWDDLVSALKSNAAAEAQPSGFPGDKPLMSLGSTPRQETREQRLNSLKDQLQFSRV